MYVESDLSVITHAVSYLRGSKRYLTVNFDVNLLQCSVFNNVYMASIGLLLKQTLMLSSTNEPCHVFITHTHLFSFLKFMINKAKKYYS